MQHRETPQRIDQIALTGDHTQRGVVVTSHRLGRRMQHQIHTVIERSHTERRGEGGIDHGDRTFDRTEIVEVDQIEQRIGRRLGEHQHRATRYHRIGERARLRAIDERDVDTEPRAHTGEQLHGSAVQLLLRHDVIALGAQPQDHPGDRAHARGVGPRRLGPLEFGHRALEGIHGRVAVTAVELLGSGRMGHLAPFFERPHVVGGRRPEHRRH